MFSNAMPPNQKLHHEVIISNLTRKVFKIKRVYLGCNVGEPLCELVSKSSPSSKRVGMWSIIVMNNND